MLYLSNLVRVLPTLTGKTTETSPTTTSTAEKPTSATINDSNNFELICDIPRSKASLKNNYFKAYILPAKEPDLLFFFGN